MKRTTSAVIGVALLAMGVVANAAVQTDSKDECLVYGKNCPTVNQADSLPERIGKLRVEIAKGEGVYTGVELKLLGHKLKDAEAMLRSLNKSGK